jgi:hypothetical protein
VHRWYKHWRTAVTRRVDDRCSPRHDDQTTWR